MRCFSCDTTLNKQCSVKRGLNALAKSIDPHHPVLTLAQTFRYFQELSLSNDNSTLLYSRVLYEINFMNLSLCDGLPVVMDHPDAIATARVWLLISALLAKCSKKITDPQNTIGSFNCFLFKILDNIQIIRREQFSHGSTMFIISFYILTTTVLRHRLVYKLWQNIFFKGGK